MNYDNIWYTGIVHCTPENWRGKKIIYNIAARNTQDCREESINSKGKPYDTNKNYDEDYKTTLAGSLPLPDSINSCGPILLSEALQVIQQHSKRNYSDTCLIKIYINACLSITDFDRTIAFYEKRSNDERISSSRRNLISHGFTHKSILDKNKEIELEITDAIKKINQTIIQINKEMTEVEKDDMDSYAQLMRNLLIQEEELAKQTELLKVNTENKGRLQAGFERYSELTKKDIFNHEYALDMATHKVKSKLIDSNMVKSLDEFKSIDIDEPLFSTYLFMLKDKHGNIIELTIKTDKLDKKSNHAMKFKELEDYLNNALEQLLKINPSLFSKSFSLY